MGWAPVQVKGITPGRLAARCGRAWWVSSSRARWTLATATNLETVTPAMARAMLECNTKNRRMRPSWVKFLARCITEDRWHVTHQGIAFNGDGTLLDGQHRLAAIVQANKPVKVMVTRGLDCDAMYAIDGGKTRDICDIAGPLGLGLDLGRDTVATARAMLASGVDPSKLNITREEVLQFITENQEAVAFANRVVAKNTGVTHACVRGAVGRAWYTADRDRLEEFGAAYCTGVTNGPQDSAAAILRTAYLRDRRSFGSRAGRSSLYRKTQAALRAFLQRRPVTKLYEAESELFPIPHDED
jgi:hypothetical protein